MASLRATVVLTFALLFFAEPSLLGSHTIANGQREFTTPATSTPGVINPQDCADLSAIGIQTSGTYHVGHPQPFQVSCDMDTAGGGWTVIQRRQDGSVAFNNTWDVYVQGFGDKSGEFWLGLNKIHNLTTQTQTELYIYLEDWEEESRYAQYSTFSVGDENSNYAATISGYNGDAGDSLITQTEVFFSINGKQFTTQDRDNDNNGGNCATTNGQGGWWYPPSCGWAMLNGRYLTGCSTPAPPSCPSAEGIVWYSWKANEYSLKRTTMMIRPDSFPNSPLRTCENGGVLTPGLFGTGVYTCTCQPGWEWTYCEHDIDECASRPCGAHGMCVDEVNSYTCNCEAGWTGGHCETILDCPVGYQLFGDACFKVFNEVRNYSSAEATCATDGGIVAEPRNHAVNVFLIFFKDSVNAYVNFWIGLTDREQEATWRWNDGEELDANSFTGWADGEPNNKSNEDCAVLGSDSKWNDLGCTKNCRFICQRPASARPKVSIYPLEIHDLVVGETVTITCNATGFFSDYNYQWTVDGMVVPNQGGPLFSYNAGSGVHKIMCKVTSVWGKTESENSTVVVLPEGTMTFVSSIRITARNFTPEMADPNSAAFKNISAEIKDWYQQAVESVQGQVSIRVKDAKPGSVITSQNINVQDAVLQDKDLYDNISNALRTAAQSSSSLGVDPNSVTLLSATTCYGETITMTNVSSNRVTLTFLSSAGYTHAYSSQRCANNTENAGIPLAVRRCVGSFQTGVSWTNPELLDCGMDLFNLAQMRVTPENVAEVAADLQILTSIGESLTAGNITDASTVLGNIANTTTDENVGYSLVVSIDQIMNADDGILYQSQVQDQAPSRIVQTLEHFADRVNLTTNHFRRIEQNIGMVIDEIRATELTNSVGFASLEGSEDLEDGLVQSYSDSSFIPDDQVDASIALPEDLGSVVAFLKENISDPTDLTVRLSFIIYQNSRLFQSNQTASSSTDTTTRVNGRVIASRVTGFKLKNLTNPVVTRYLPIVQNSTDSTLNNVRCVSWDFNTGGGAGAWSTQGCDFVGIDNDRVVCECNHLTNFAVLMDIYGGLQSFVLDLISKIGITLSITGLTLTLIIHLAFKQLRQNRPQRILINLCFALLATLIIFLAGISATSSPIGCTVVAFLLHYFLLAVFMWMAIEAFNMYLAFVKVLGVHVSKFLLKAAVIAWGLPVVIAIVTLVVDVPSTYPDGQETYRSTSFCWLQGNQLYFGFLLPAGLVLLFNTIVYGMVISKLACRGRANGKVADSRKARQQLRIAIAVMVLVGLTWIFGFLMISDGRIVFSYLFCIFNSLQGFFIFIFHCLPHMNVHSLWFRVLLAFKCCGCPVDDYRTTKSSTWTPSHNQADSTRNVYLRGQWKSSVPEALSINMTMNSI